jgi:hypothetical protein
MNAGSVRQSKREVNWQERHRPLMVATLVGLGCFFFLATLWQLVTLEQRIVEQRPEWDSNSVARAVKDDRLRVLGVLESEIVGRRYHLAGALLAGRVWQLYLGFVTGMILSLVGAVFILGKLKESESESSLESASIKATLKSSSPGLVLAILGVSLMVMTIGTNHKIEVEDRPHYLTDMPAPNRVEADPAGPRPPLPEPTGTGKPESNGANTKAPPKFP